MIRGEPPLPHPVVQLPLFVAADAAAGTEGSGESALGKIGRGGVGGVARFLPLNPLVTNNRVAVYDVVTGEYLHLFPFADPPFGPPYMMSASEGVIEKRT